MTRTVPRTVIVWQLSLLAIALGCTSSADPLYGARPQRPQRAPIQRPPPPAPQAMVSDQESPDGQEAANDPTQEAPSDPTPDPTNDQRDVNASAYENDYLRQKERLFPAHLGRWIAIVGGRLLPTDERGRVEPAATFDDCVKAAEAADASALHRYLFRVGEEGDVVYSDSSATPRNVVGAALKSALGVAAAFDAKAGAITWRRGEKSRTFPLEREQIEISLSDPQGLQSMSARVADSAGFGGFVLLDATTADLLDAEKHEIPGRVVLRTTQGTAELRRARVRVGVRELALDEVVPAAVWPR